MGATTPAPGFGNASRHDGALTGLRICDLSGVLAGAGSTRMLAAFGAQIIRVEDPVNQGRWDIVRTMAPAIGDDRTHEGGSGFNNHNVEKLGVTINLRPERGKELLRRLVAVSDAVTENFAAGVMERLGFGYEQLRAIREDIVYVSNSGFGHTGPYRTFKSWGPIAQAVSGLTWSSGLPDEEPAGWGYSYMDHTGGYIMAIGLLSALWHRRRTGQGQWVDMSCSEAAITLNGPALLDVSVNQRPLRGPGRPHSNRSDWPAMAPHGVYPCAAADTWVAIACRHDDDWRALAKAIGQPWADAELTLADRMARQDDLDDQLSQWTAGQDRDEVTSVVRGAGVPCSPVLRPSERCGNDPDTTAWGLWPQVQHTRHGSVSVDGLPVHLSATDWRIERGGPMLGEHNDRVYGEVLGLAPTEIEELRAEGVI